MPRKNVITLTELALLSIVWSTCQTTWKDVVINGVAAAVGRAIPSAGPMASSAVTGAIILAALYALILLTENVNIGNYKVFELDLAEK